MNPCFRYVKLRYVDLRKLSYSTVTALKRPELAVQKDEKLFQNNWVEADGNVRDGLKFSDVFHTPEILNRTQKQQKHPDLEKRLHEQYFDVEQLLEVQGNAFDCVERLTSDDRNNVQSKISDNNDINKSSEFNGTVSELDIDLKQFLVSKNTTVSQKENLAVGKDSDKSPDELSNRKLQNTGEDGGPSKDDNKSDDKPSYAQLQAVANYYENQIKALHAQSEDFSRGFHHRNIIFENNYTRMPASCQGMDKYRVALAKMRILGSFSYFTFRFQPVNIRCDMEEGTVVLHWRLYYINNIRFFTNAAPRVLMDRSLKNAYDEDEAISTFYVNGMGQITKHKVDKTIPLKGEKKAVGLKERLRKRFNLALT